MKILVVLFTIFLACLIGAVFSCGEVIWSGDQSFKIDLTICCAIGGLAFFAIILSAFFPESQNK